MKKFSQYMMLILSALSVMSCTVRYGILDSVPVTLAKPEKSVSIDSDTDFNATFQETLNCFRIQIVNDTIMVLQEQANDGNSYHFKAYSTRSLNYLGAFIRNGRGPEEMTYPHLARCNSEEKYLNMNLNTVGKAYSIDVKETLMSGKTVVAKTFMLPSAIIDWIPLADSGQFTLQSEKGHLVFHTIGADEEVINTFNIAEGIADERFITYLSSLLVRNRTSGQVAEVMLQFPLLNIFDTREDKARSIAVDREFRKWETVISRHFTMDMKQYYVGATSSDDYIFAAYKNITLNEMLNGCSSTFIHVFNWDGHFLYNISVAEDIVMCPPFVGRFNFRY